MSGPFSIPLTEPLEQALVTERRGPHVVAIGGGKGLAAALAAILRYAGRIDAIVTVADDGGSSGRPPQISRSRLPGIFGSASSR